MATSTAVMLPGNVKPVKYQLVLTPDLQSFTFQGEETVHIQVIEPTSSITMNCEEIAVQSCRLTLSDGTALDASETAMDSSDETVTFQFSRTIAPGDARLDIRYTGELNDKLRGFYRSRYTDAEGRERYMASTQFEATDARRAFPCWDEPALKATFDVTLVIPDDLVAVSNMPVVSETPAGPGLKRVRFAETPIMSTYLLAFVVGDLRAVEQTAPGGTLVRVWATRGKEEQGRFALETSVRLLEYFNSYFGIPYPLPKLDHLAIPDFAAGAMENWGAITYRETALLVDPRYSSAATRQQVAAIVAHEMAHMWFGDLVTMAWWDDLWLNESFASWMGDKAVDHLFPDWDMWTQFVSSDTNTGLGLDGLKNSHPIEQPVKNPAEIGQLFDAISYSKGASILRMLEDYLGAEVFQQGLHDYLTAHQYANAATRDLWDALGQVSRKPVAAMMDTWVTQTGYPVLEVEAERKGRRVDIAFSQRRFVYENVLGQQEPDTTLWHVPVSVRARDASQQASALMEGRRATVRLQLASADGWIKVNPQQTGFYRVKYTAEDWGRLVRAIEAMELPAVDRLGIQNDAYALSRAGYIPATQFLSVAEAYRNEMDATVLADLAANLGGLENLLTGQEFFPAFEAFARRLFQTPGRKIGWDARPGEGHLDALRRSTVLLQLGNYGDQDTLREARRRFDTYVRESSSVHPDIRGVVLALSARQGDRSMYETMWELRRRAPTQEEQVRLLVALTQFQQKDLLQDTLERSLSREVRHHETIRAVIEVAGNRHGRELAWRFLKDNWPEFDRRYGEGGFGLMRLVSITGGFTTQEMLEDVQEFFQAHPVPAAERSIRQSLERIRLNIAWLDKNRDELARYFAG